MKKCWVQDSTKRPSFATVLHALRQVKSVNDVYDNEMKERKDRANGSGLSSLSLSSLNNGGLNGNGLMGGVGLGVSQDGSHVRNGSYTSPTHSSNTTLKSYEMTRSLTSSEEREEKKYMV